MRWRSICSLVFGAAAVDQIACSPLSNVATTPSSTSPSGASSLQTTIAADERQIANVQRAGPGVPIYFLIGIAFHADF